VSRPYFRTLEGAPPPLRAEVSRKVRFEEVDPLGIVWHGRYPSFFEDGRVALGEKYGIGYLDCYEAGVMTPIKKMHLDYRLPLRFGESFSVEAIMHWSEAARINFEFIIRNQGGNITTTGYTVQMMLDREENILLIPPPFYREFLDRWRAGALP
jgi:acyl-CoA thioester hydrolase